MSITTEQLEAMLAAATPGPWAMGPDEEGEPAQCITADGFDIATAWGGYNRADADTRLIAAAPEVTAELIAAHKRIAEMKGALDSLLDAITASDMVGDRSLTITGPTANLKWLLEAEEEARDALGDAP